MRGILALGDSCVNKPSHFCQDPRDLPRLLRLGLGYNPTKVNKESTLFRWGGWGTEGETRAPPEVIFMFPQSGAAEASKDQIIIQVVPGVPDGHVPE